MGDYDIHNDNSSLTVIAIALSMGITIVAISLRLLARRFNRIPLGIDDYFILLGAFFTLSHSLVLSFAKKYGNGRHAHQVQPHDLNNYAKVFYISEQLYGLSVTAIKTSILLFYRRLFPTAQFRTWTTIVLIFVGVWLIANNVAAAVQCLPVRKAWEHDLPGHCVNPIAFVIGIQVPNVFLDVVILALPMPMVYRLRLSRTKRLRVAAIFLLGGLSVIVAAVRLAVLTSERTITDFTCEIVLAQRASQWRSPIKRLTRALLDPTAKCSWTVIEPAMGILSACLPTMGPLFKIQAHITEFYSTICSHLAFRRFSETNIDGGHELPINLTGSIDKI